MRSSFGQLAQALRSRIGISQTAFAQRVGESIARVSNLEYQRTHIGVAVLEKYVALLAANTEEAEKLRAAAEFSNKKRGLLAKQVPHAEITTLLVEHFSSLSLARKQRVLAALEEIRQAIAEEKGSEAAFLTEGRATFPAKVKIRRAARGQQRPSLHLDRFVELCLLAWEIRRRFCSDGRRIDLERFMAQAEAEDESLGFDIVSRMPDFAASAYAVIVGEPSVHRIIIEERRFKVGVKGSGFFRHTIMHEFAHHILHADLLETETTCYLEPSELAFLDEASLDAEPPKGFFFAPFINTIVEEEAECFATLMLVPWTEFLRRTPTYQLAADFGADRGGVDRYGAYFKQPAVVRALTNPK